MIRPRRRTLFPAVLLAALLVLAFGAGVALGQKVLVAQASAPGTAVATGTVHNPKGNMDAVISTVSPRFSYSYRVTCHKGQQKKTSEDATFGIPSSGLEGKRKGVKLPLDHPTRCKVRVEAHNYPHSGVIPPDTITVKVYAKTD